MGLVEQFGLGGFHSFFGDRIGYLFFFFSHCSSLLRWLQVRSLNAWANGCADVIQNGQFSPQLFTG